METEASQPNNYGENTETPKTREPNGRWVKGYAPNPAGRPKGKTMKEWAREYLTRLTDEERDAFFDGMPKELIWRMAEGNPESKNDITSNGRSIGALKEMSDAELIELAKSTNRSNGGISAS